MNGQQTLIADTGATIALRMPKAVLEDTSSPLIELCARNAYAVMRAYCASIGEGSWPSWENATEYGRYATRAGVRSVLENPDMEIDPVPAGATGFFANQWPKRPIFRAAVLEMARAMAELGVTAEA